ncbi:hypothetical protein SAMN05216369_0908 [Marinobacter antarcticus]|uniref:Uncharacterized protein n=1 Tax=Marinobacter antarcticus TaxID=564117 RepID=A0A1M6QGU0_9GAMM|nr:hypothetical protein SAMN05216369_0908 [Marinobacter antarcticus]
MPPYSTFTGRFSDEALWYNTAAARILRHLKDARLPADDRRQVTNAGIRLRLVSAGHSEPALRITTDCVWYL